IGLLCVPLELSCVGERVIVGVWVPCPAFRTFSGRREATVLTPDSALPPLPPSGTSLGEFVARLALLVRADAAEARRQVSDIWTRPLAERVAAGRAIADVRIVEVRPDGMLTLACSRNESRFR